MQINQARSSELQTELIESEKIDKITSKLKDHLKIVLSNSACDFKSIFYSWMLRFDKILFDSFDDLDPNILRSAIEPIAFSILSDLSTTKSDKELFVLCSYAQLINETSLARDISLKVLGLIKNRDGVSFKNIRGLALISFLENYPVTECLDKYIYVLKLLEKDYDSYFSIVQNKVDHCYGNFDFRFDDYEKSLATIDRVIKRLDEDDFYNLALLHYNKARCHWAVNRVDTLGEKQKTLTIDELEIANDYATRHAMIVGSYDGLIFRITSFQAYTYASMGDYNRFKVASDFSFDFLSKISLTLNDQYLVDSLFQLCMSSYLFAEIDPDLNLRLENSGKKFLELTTTDTDGRGYCRLMVLLKLGELKSREGFCEESQSYCDQVETEAAELQKTSPENTYYIELRRLDAAKIIGNHDLFKQIVDSLEGVEEFYQEANRYKFEIFSAVASDLANQNDPYGAIPYFEKSFKEIYGKLITDDELVLDIGKLLELGIRCLDQLINSDKIKLEDQRIYSLLRDHYHNSLIRLKCWQKGEAIMLESPEILSA